MKILFDQNVPKGLAQYLPGHDVTRTPQVGWATIKNGELLSAAENTGFQLLLTCDKSMRYEQNMTGRKIAVIALSTNDWRLMKPFVKEIADAVRQARPGAFMSVECGVFRRPPKGIAGPSL